ncbi:MAG TPA: DUF4193 family protein [Acidimicrobiales bacterium]|nr:DUF4193 family protein [Acidimicrobiales bacterium]
MASNSDADEVFDEEELAEGFDEEIVGAEIDDAESVDVEDLVADEDEDDADVELDEDEVPVEAVVVDDEDIADDADVELALDEVLAETIRRTTTPEDDDDLVGEVDPTAELVEAILPKQDDEFRCSSCRLLKKTSQLADEAKMLCRDCV